MTDQVPERIAITDPNDVALMKIAAGAMFSGTTLPSGYIVPVAPEGKGYYPQCCEDGTITLVLENLHAIHKK